MLCRALLLHGWSIPLNRPAWVGHGRHRLPSAPTAPFQLRSGHCSCTFCAVQYSAYCPVTLSSTCLYVWSGVLGELLCCCAVHLLRCAVAILSCISGVIHCSTRLRLFMRYLAFAPSAATMPQVSLRLRFTHQRLLSSHLVWPMIICYPDARCRRCPSL